MNKIISGILMLCMAMTPVCVQSEPVRIVFGSCNKHTINQTPWAAIQDEEPDLFIWTGDIIYADTQDMEEMQRMYDAQKQREDYTTFREHVKVIGVWDDHDYGHNDAGKEYPRKAEARRLLLGFFDEPVTSPRRRQEGIYTSYTLGQHDQRVKIILLDTRYHRDAPGADGDMLGEFQWQWLRDQLTYSTAQLHLIVTSIQFLADEHRWESWGRFPKARQRMQDLLKETQTPGVILISGDRHFAEISRDDHPARFYYPLYEITSSGLTHAIGGNYTEPNRFRISKLVVDRNYGFIEIDWSRPISVSLQIRDQNNQTRVHQKIYLHDLKPSRTTSPGL